MRPPFGRHPLPRHEGGTAEQDDGEADEDRQVKLREAVPSSALLMPAFEIGGAHLLVGQQLAPGALSVMWPLTMT